MTVCQKHHGRYPALRADIPLRERAMTSRSAPTDEAQVKSPPSLSFVGDLDGVVSAIDDLLAGPAVVEVNLIVRQAVLTFCDGYVITGQKTRVSIIWNHDVAANATREARTEVVQAVHPPR